MPERFAPAGSVPLKICEVYRTFGNAYACDPNGRRFLVNEGSEGIQFESLEVGVRIFAHVTERNYVDRLWLRAD